MDTSPEELPGLVPPVGSLIALVKDLVECPWPDSEQQREALFRQLDFVSGPPIDDPGDGPGTRHFTLNTALPGEIFSLWASHRGRFMGINLQVYGAREPNSPTAWQGLGELRRQLTALYGPPTLPWEDQEVPPHIWAANGRTVVVHFFHARDSGVMLSIDDTAVATEAEAEEVAREPLGQSRPASLHDSHADAVPQSP